MSKVTEIFVKRYKSSLGKTNVEENNLELWPTYEQEFSKLEFESEYEKSQTMYTIVKEIATVYYRSLREEVYENIIGHWKNLNDQDFMDLVYKRYKCEDNLEKMVSEKFPEYHPFRDQGLSPLWENQKDILEKYLQLAIFKSLTKKGHIEEAKQFWELFGAAIKALIKEVSDYVETAFK